MSENYPVEFERALAAIDAAGLPFVVVGGVAVVLHGVDRLTADLDVVVMLEDSALAEALTGLAAIGYRPRAPVPIEAFIDPENRRRWREEKHMRVFSLWDPANRLPVLDLFVDYPVAFDRLIANAIPMKLGQVDVRVAAIDDLITMKAAAGRERDLSDIEALRERQRRD